MTRVLDRLLRRRRVGIELRFPEITFHMEVLPDGTVKPMLDDPSILDPTPEGAKEP